MEFPDEQVQAEAAKLRERFPGVEDAAIVRWAEQELYRDWRARRSYDHSQVADSTWQPGYADLTFWSHPAGESTGQVSYIALSRAEAAELRAQLDAYLAG